MKYVLNIAVDNSFALTVRSMRTVVWNQARFNSCWSNQSVVRSVLLQVEGICALEALLLHQLPVCEVRCQHSF